MIMLQGNTVSARCSICGMLPEGLRMRDGPGIAAVQQSCSIAGDACMQDA